MTQTVLAHGLGGSTDLPIPVTYALIGAAWALTFTFAVVALAWRKPRFDLQAPGLALPRWVTTAVDAPVTRWTVGLLALAVAIWIAVTTTVSSGSNALPGVFYVLLWVGIVALSILFGPVWRVLSPVRTVIRLLRVRRDAYPARLGYWPAAAGLFAFVWLELASPIPGAVGPVRIWLAVYFGVTLAGALICGTRWCSHADPFEVYSVVASRCSPLRRNASGRIAVGNPFNHLPTLPIRPATVMVLAVLLGSTAFDSFSAAPTWRGFVEAHAHGTWQATALKTVGLAVFVTVVAVTFSLAARATGGVDRALRRQLPGLMAHSLIPIVIGYVFAHYLTYLVEKGQQTVFMLLGMPDAHVNYVLSLHPSVLATTKVLCVLFGHIAAVIAAHDCALRVLPKRHQLTGQLTMMLVMVGYTFTGLYLLFGG
ncbi:hypothetical protein BOO86_16710 [Mycobacterium sp. CBMA 234]|uniref:hypothetical protein n=1 Tax=Mycolicibacterium sp. CBMA 234 TaxID=1918495 RepID=UPI0013916E51|nr:hypothetical protein [Mycolicibacterium sp. CBMA 234]MUL66119.1 hypothetical protein [Mycolicibacterium sp. CBMA 234]